MLTFETKNMSGHLLVCTLFFLLSAFIFSCSGTVPEDPGDLPDPEPEEETEIFPGPSAFLVNDSLDIGFNLGNVYENGIQALDVNQNRRIIDLYVNAGAKHVRIPVTWTESVNGTKLFSGGSLNINGSNFTSLKQTINYALNQGLFVVINAHHEREFKESYNGSAASKKEIYDLWKAIATHFEDYSYRLVFEIMNEPDGAFGQWGGNPDPFNSTALSYTREMYTEGLRAIRETGGRNETRVVMISTNGMGNHSMIDEVYPTKSALPGGGTDEHLMIQVHTYDPWEFCGQDGANAAYPGDAAIRQSILQVAKHGQSLGVPLNYGEFGVGRQNNQDSRNTDLVRGYYKTVVSTCRDNGMSSSVWDDRGWFGLTNNDGNNFSFTYNIVPFMFEN